MGGLGFRYCSIIKFFIVWLILKQKCKKFGFCPLLVTDFIGNVMSGRTNL
jgi:hypothetical protein